MKKPNFQTEIPEAGQNRKPGVSPGPSKRRGFTLIEIIVVIIIVGILVAVAVPMYVGKIPPRPNRIYELSPPELKKQLLILLQEPPIDLKIVREYDGLIETTHEVYEGEVKGLWVGKRRWQERAKYFFEIRPKWEGPRISELYVKAETEERRDENNPWKPNKSSKVEERISRILRIIDSKVWR